MLKIGSSNVNISTLVCICRLLPVVAFSDTLNSAYAFP
jgi:hypothetical protein